MFTRTIAVIASGEVWRAWGGLIIISPNKRSRRGPAGVGRELDSSGGGKICTRELASVVSSGLRGASHGLSWPPVDNETDNIYSLKASIMTIGPRF